jgi:membrane protease YdiL (CAAX protease family)
MDSFSTVNWSKKRVIIGLGAWTCYVAILQIFIIPSVRDSSLIIISVAWLISGLWMLLFPLFCVNKDNLLNLKTKLSKIIKEAFIAMGFLVVALLLLGIANFVIEQFIPKPTEDPWAILGNLSKDSRWMLFIIIVFAISPLVEEIFFRGFIYNALRQRYNTYLCIALQAIIFAAFHYKMPYSNLYYLIGIFVMGILLAIAYERRKTLLSPIFMHSFHVWLAFAVQRANK